MPMSFIPTQSPAEGTFVHGLQLFNATWDTSHSVLDELLPGDGALQPVPPVWIKPVEASTNQPPSPSHNVYACPLFTCPDVELQQDSNLVAHVPLPTAHPPRLWAQKRVALCCC
ncbi:hypothetical protein BaRGS_00008010 [Batillaria attramentaria]|uniref:Dynein heavy chain C-terminal domain-containing protein n=1 Tax=Batillaria attramentaria TaxID=370345 RepID=A0ABD0LNE8_9CAEN